MAALHRKPLSLSCLVLLAALLTVALAGQNRDFYKILEIQRSASPADIKKAYRAQSLKWHPDKNPDDDTAKERFQDVSSAYEALSDADKRRKYDQGGEEELNKPEPSGHDPFGSFFGDIFGRQQEQTGPSMNLKVRVTLEQLYVGHELDVTYNRKIICPHCRGSGADSPEDMQQCPSCKGQGFTIQKQQIAPGFVQQFQQPCNKCDQTGKIIKKKCHVCGSTKLIDSLDSLSIYIEKGAPDNHKSNYKNSADEYINVRSGNVIVTITEMPHAVFERKDKDLKLKIEITLEEALLGFKRTIIHLDGHKVEVNREKLVTKPGLMIRIKKEGMPVFQQYGDFGDLLVTFIVNLPTPIPQEQKTQWKDFFTA